MIMGVNRYEEVVELYECVVMSFKLAKSWRRAADAYEALAMCRVMMKEMYDVVLVYVDCV